MMQLCNPWGSLTLSFLCMVYRVDVCVYCVRVYACVCMCECVVCPPPFISHIKSNLNMMCMMDVCARIMSVWICGVGMCVCV